MFRNFIKDECPALFIGIAGYLLCVSVMLLYTVGFETILYCGVLYALFLLIVFVIRFIRYYRRMIRLKEFRTNSVLYTVPTVVPESSITQLYIPETAAEAELTEMIDKLRTRCAVLETVLKNDRNEYNDYYTTWVHQIKTPIAAMQMLLQKEDTKENRELLAELFRINQYVEMALGYIRLDSDSNDLVIREYDADALVKQAIHKFAPQFIEKKLTLSYDLPEGLKVKTDEKWFVFVIEQILSNAVKYTKQGGITIKCTDDGKLAISDTGMGISPEDLPRIFEKGYTGFNGRADKKATGLGLYLCKRACDMLGIDIGAESVQGSGSTFYLDLTQRKLQTE